MRDDRLLEAWRETRRYPALWLFRLRDTFRVPPEPDAPIGPVRVLVEPVTGGEFELSHRGSAEGRVVLGGTAAVQLPPMVPSRRRLVPKDARLPLVPLARTTDRQALRLGVGDRIRIEHPRLVPASFTLTAEQVRDVELDPGPHYAFPELHDPNGLSGLVLWGRLSAALRGAWLRLAAAPMGFRTRAATLGEAPPPAVASNIEQGLPFVLWLRRLRGSEPLPRRLQLDVHRDAVVRSLLLEIIPDLPPAERVRLLEVFPASAQPDVTPLGPLRLVMF